MKRRRGELEKVDGIGKVKSNWTSEKMQMDIKKREREERKIGIVRDGLEESENGNEEEQKEKRKN